jgi:hypothetical protein
MPPRRWQRPRARSRRRRDGGRVEVAACRRSTWGARGPPARPRGRRVQEGLHRFGRREAGGTLGGSRRRRRVQMAARRLTAREARGPSAGSRGRRVGGLGLLATARVGGGPLTRPGCRRAHRPGPNRRRAGRPVDGGVHRSVRPPRGIHGRPSGPTRRDIRTRWTVDIESREPLQPPRSPGGRFHGRLPAANRRIIRPENRGNGWCRGRFPTANGRGVRPAGGIRGRRGGRFGTANRCAIRPGGGSQGRGCWPLHSAGFGSIWTGSAGRGRWTVRRRRAAGVAGGPVRWGGGTWSGRCSRWRRLLGDRLRLLGPHRHRPRRSAGLLRSWTVRSPPTRPNGRALLRIALDHRARLDLGVWTRIHPRPLTRLIPTRRTRTVPGLRTWMIPDLRLRTRPTFSFWAPVGLLPGTWVCLPLRARVVLGVRVCRGTGRPDRLVRWGAISVAHPRPTRPALIGRDRGPGRRGGLFRRPLARVRRRSARLRNGPLRPRRQRP